MMFFSSRQKAREFAAKIGAKPIDNGPEAKRRWAVKVLKG